jgi:hypothetical protein
MVLPDILLVLGATMRLTRLVVTDDLGAWLVREPLDRYCIRQDNAHLDRLYTGVACPFCVGTWIGYGTLASYAVFRRSPVTLSAWRFVTAGLALNYVVGHVGSRLD